MKTLYVFVLLCVPTLLRGETRVMQDATPDSIVGVWQALVQDESMATEIYQMVISETGEAKFVDLFAHPSGGAIVHFFGRASSFKLTNGILTVRFAVVSEPRKYPGIIFGPGYWDWVEIQGHAVAEGPVGAIRGKIITHTEGDQLEHEVAFRKGHWFGDLQNLAAKAQPILKGP